MANNIEQFRLLAQRYIDNQLTEEEEEKFFTFVQQAENRLLLQQVLDEQFRSSEVSGPSISVDRLQVMRDQILASRPVGVFPLRRVAVAAAVLLIAGSVYLWRSHKQEIVTTPVTATRSADIAPGRSGAILTLANGKKVVLDSMNNGEIAGTQAVLKDGELIYQASKNLSYNTMTTPKGRQFHVQLPDGSEVWLNAASSITYPTAFNDRNREVAITGEVYFEVAGNQDHPFIVKVNEQTRVEVLGTHFNVNAYGNEPAIRTTLLEGKVKVGEAILRPGEQAVSAPHSSVIVDNSPDIKQVMAWKNGLFSFDGNDIKVVMNEIARWYDLDVKYESEPQARQIVGEIQRSLTLSQVMTVLKKLDINYRLEGRTLIITK